MGIYGLLQKFGVSFIIRAGVARIESTLGNAAFVAGYFLLALGITAYVIYREYLEKRKIKILYLLAIIIQFFAFIFAGIRGGYLALIIALVILFPILISRQKNKKLKVVYLLILLFLVSAYCYIYFNRFQPWVNESAYLSRFTSIVSFQSHSVQTRFISWRAGLSGFSKAPLLGIGMENYSYYFDQYLPPVFYSFSKTETWFDRAHNAVVEVLVANGIVGIISYLAIFGILIYYLFKIFLRDKQNNFFMTLIFSILFLGYFIQNFFVFDTLVVFLLFGLILGYLNYFYHQEKINLPEKRNNQIIKNPLIYFFLFISCIFTIYCLIINFRILKIAYLNAEFQLNILRKKDYQSALANAKEIFAINSSLDYLNNKSANLMTDALVNNLESNVNDSNFFESLNLTLAKLEKDVANYPSETYSLVVLGRTYNALASYISDSDFKSQALNKAFYYLEKAKNFSPGRLQVYYLLAQNKMLVNDFEKTKEYLDKAIALNPDLSDSYWFMAISYFNFGEELEGLKYVNLALDKEYSISNLEQATQMAQFAAKNKDYATMARLYEVIINLDPNKAENYGNLATAYALLGDKDKAIKNARKAAELDPSYQAELDTFIKQVEAGTFKLSNE